MCTFFYVPEFEGIFLNLANLARMQEDTPYIKLKISKIEQAANKVKLFYFEPAAIKYKAGQYLTFSIPENEIELRRSYSIASSPDLNEPLFIGVKRVENGLFSRKLYDLAAPGDELITLGAGGVFVLPKDLNAFPQLYFFAAGSGIIPIFSLVKTALYINKEVEIILVYSNHSEADTIFYTELQELKKNYGERFKLKFLFSNSKDLLNARLHSGMILRILKTYSQKDFSKALYYVCGPENYMLRCTSTLRNLFIPQDHIKKEVFFTRLPAIRNEPPDTSPYTAKLFFQGAEHIIEGQYPESLLQSAKKNGIILPYSCEAGRCGNCIAKCESGKVWMAYNEVLTEAEVKEGYFLTCTGYPMGENVEVII